MTPRLTMPLTFAALVALAACGGGSGSDGGSGGGPTAGTNGLDFGEAGQQLSDAEGTAISMRSASFQVGAASSIGNATITLDTGFFNGGPANRANLDGSIQILGQTVTITDGSGTLPTGEEVFVTFEPNRVGDFAAAVEVSVTSGAGMGTIDGEQAYVFGFETNPDEIEAIISGTAIYSGDFLATGSVNGAANTDTPYEGAITIEVDFLGTGNADVDLDGQLDGAINVDLTANNIPLSGNGFAGDLGCASGCTDEGSSVDATFYGPNAAEVGGVLAIDIEVGGDDYDGVGTFVID
ncbi:MAG: transferrin-binding protein-like solute binding protein [Pseudomonadota bacterium]